MIGWIGDRIEGIIDWWNDLTPGARGAFKGAGLGAGAGLAAGIAAGQIHAAKEVVITRTFLVPDTVPRSIGDIPSDSPGHDGASQPVSHGEAPWGWRPVVEPLPQYRDGSVLMKDETRTLSSKSYSPTTAALVGLVEGTVIGLSAALALQVAHKIISGAAP